jgi:hypothetical protein
LSALHLAHAQSPLATVRSPLIFPSIVSAVCVVSVAFVVSRLAGLYGTGLAFTSIGRDSAPLAFTIRPMTSPVTGEPSRFLATGTVT